MNARCRNLLVAFLVGLFAVSVFAQETSQPSADKAPEGANLDAQHALLGIKLSRLHPALATQLKGVLSPEQGVIVDIVEPGSAAEKAGIKVHDIVTAYDDQKVFSAEQLVKLVHVDKPGREVTITLVRDGKLEKVKVTLAVKPPPRSRPPEAAGGRGGFGGGGPGGRGFGRGVPPAPPPQLRYYYPAPQYRPSAPLPFRPLGGDMTPFSQSGGADLSDDSGFYGYGL